MIMNESLLEYLTTSGSYLQQIQSLVSTFPFTKSRDWGTFSPPDDVTLLFIYLKDFICCFSLQCDPKPVSIPKNTDISVKAEAMVKSCHNNSLHLL